MKELRDDGGEPEGRRSANGVGRPRRRNPDDAARLDALARIVANALDKLERRVRDHSLSREEREMATRQAARISTLGYRYVWPLGREKAEELVRLVSDVGPRLKPGAIDLLVGASGAAWQAAQEKTMGYLVNEVGEN